MKARALAWWRRETSLARQFALLSFIVIALITLALSLAMTYSLRKDLLDREWRTTADFIRTEALQHLTPSDFAAPGTQTAQERLRFFYEQTVVMPEIVRVKIYDVTMRVIWSDEARLIGRRFPNNRELIGAVTGQTTVNLKVGQKKGENIYEGAERQLVEVYVPIVFPGDPRVVGVVETYKAPETVFRNIRRGQVTVVGMSLAGGAILYLSLFWIVRRAGRRINAQHQALEERSRELTAANQELRTVQAQLLEAERMAAIGEVVTAVTHGIRNPLANIRASAQVANLDCTKCGSPRAEKSLENIMAQVDRLEGRIKELLQFVRPAERQNKPLHLNIVLRGVLQMMTGRATARVKIEERLAPTLPTIMGDPVLIEQVFVNLIGNAIDAVGDGGGTITVMTGTLPGASQVFVEVHDTGPGIPPEEIPKIFDLFYTNKAQGTGLGLAIARKVTEAHGGTISAWGGPAEGATFRVTLPAQGV